MYDGTEDTRIVSLRSNSIKNIKRLVEWHSRLLEVRDIMGTDLYMFSSDSNSSVCSMDWAYVHRTWEKWASNNVGTSGQPLKAALLINYDPTGPSRLLSTIVEEEGIKADPIEISQFVNYVKCNKMQKETFFIAPNEYIVTSIHENWFHGRCISTSSPAGEGAIMMQTAAFLLLALYNGSIGSASGAVTAADQLVLQLGRKNL